MIARAVLAMLIPAFILLGIQTSPQTAQTQPRPTILAYTPSPTLTPRGDYDPGIVIRGTPAAYPAPEAAQERQQAAGAIIVEWIAPSRARVTWSGAGAIYRQPAGSVRYIWLTRGDGGSFELPPPPPIDQAYQPQAGDTYVLTMDSDGTTRAATLPQPPPPSPPTPTPPPPTPTPTPEPIRPHTIRLPIIAR